MKGIASDICSKCKYCEGMVEDSFYICGVTHSDGGLYHLMGVEDELYCTAYEEEINMNKVEGKVSDFCPKCKNGNVIVWKGVSNIVCEDPYDGMIKTLAADSDVCCSMFEVRKEKEPFNLNMPREAIKAIAKLNNIISELEKEKAAHLKGIERLKKSNEKLQKRNDNQITMIQGLKLQYNDLKKSSDRWRELYNSLSETCADYDKRCKEECEKKYRDEISKLQNTVTEKHVEIKGLKKDIIDLSYDRRTVESMSKKNTKLNQTISDQEVTIKALLLTIKEMCKEENENA